MCRPILTTVFPLLILNTIILFDSCLLSTFVCNCFQSIIDCLLRSRKELKFVLATHADGWVWTRRGDDVQPGGAWGGVFADQDFWKIFIFTSKISDHLFLVIDQVFQILRFFTVLNSFIHSY